MHLVARTRLGAMPLHSRAACADLWLRLARTFDVIACVLMPDHVHVLAPVDRSLALRAFARALSAFRARAARLPEVPAFEWERLPEPEKVRRDRRHIARTIRYIHLNPCRDALCADPLEWEWSTHRDWVGAIARPCVNLPRWARVLGRPARACAGWIHDYASADPSVPVPRPLADASVFASSGAADASLAQLSSAVSVVLRSPRSACSQFGVDERRLFLLAASRWTRYQAPELARWAGCDPTTVRKVVARARCEAEARSLRGADRAGERSGGASDMSASEVRALALTLADARLRATPYPKQAPSCT